MAEVTRTPPVDVLRRLRREVGFGCPVRDCGIPYLTWHHFEPPWRDEHHHRPEGMIALCSQHAAHADGGAYPDEYLKSLKSDAMKKALTVRAQLEWMRRDLLAVVGGNFYYRTDIILQMGSVRPIWFGRDEDGYLLLNVRMPTLSGMPRARIASNFLLVAGQHVTDVECSARGRKIKISYPNGDVFALEFVDVADVAALTKRYREWTPSGIEEFVSFPVTLVEVTERAAGSPIQFGPSATRLGGTHLTGSFMSNGHTAISLDWSPETVERFFPDLAGLI